MPKDQKPEQGIVRTGRGEEQPADKDRAQRDSGLETGSTRKRAAPDPAVAPGGCCAQAVSCSLSKDNPRTRKSRPHSPFFRDLASGVRRFYKPVTVGS